MGRDFQMAARREIVAVPDCWALVPKTLTCGAVVELCRDSSAGLVDASKAVLRARGFLVPAARTLP